MDERGKNELVVPVGSKKFRRVRKVSSRGYGLSSTGGNCVRLSVRVYPMKILAQKIVEHLCRFFSETIGRPTLYDAEFDLGRIS